MKNVFLDQNCYVCLIWLLVQHLEKLGHKLVDGNLMIFVVVFLLLFGLFLMVNFCGDYLQSYNDKEWHIPY